MDDAMKWLVRAKEYMSYVKIKDPHRANIAVGNLFVCDSNNQVNIYSKEPDGWDWEGQILSKAGVIIKKPTLSSGSNWKKALIELSHKGIVKKLIGD